MKKSKKVVRRKPVARKRITARQERAARALAGPAKGNKRVAAEMAGYSATTARDHTERIFTGDVMEHVRGLMDRHGLTDDVLASKHSKMLEATEDVVTPAGAVVSRADNTTQFKALELGYKMRGYLKPDTDTAGVVDRLVLAFINVVNQFVPEAARGACYEKLQAELPGAVNPATAG